MNKKVERIIKESILIQMCLFLTRIDVITKEMKSAEVLTLSSICKQNCCNWFTISGTTQHCEYIHEHVLLTLQVMIMI